MNMTKLSTKNQSQLFFCSGEAVAESQVYLAYLYTIYLFLYKYLIKHMHGYINSHFQ